MIDTIHSTADSNTPMKDTIHSTADSNTPMKDTLHSASDSKTRKTIVLDGPISKELLFILFCLGNIV
jgi:hypothetical protein